MCQGQEVISATFVRRYGDSFAHCGDCFKVTGFLVSDTVCLSRG
jgi:hypothetical protein